MYGLDRLAEVFKEAHLIPFNDSMKIVLMSDCHRGDGSPADNFLKNKRNYMEALDYYFTNGYTYIEIGDGDELWENKNLSKIIEVHKEVFIKLSEFYKRGRLYFIYGNHDIVKKDDEFLKKYKTYNNTLFESIMVYEGIVLKHDVTWKKVFLVHGHQVDFFNDKLWKIGRFFVRYFWKPIEIIGVRDPTSASQNDRKTKDVENNLLEWCKRNNCLLVAGHTHKPVFAKVGEISYFNSGSCIKNEGITAIEIAEGCITLVMWKKTKGNCSAAVVRDIVAGPERLEDY